MVPLISPPVTSSVVLKALNHAKSQIRAFDIFRTTDNGKKKGGGELTLKLKEVLIIYSINLLVFMPI